MPGNYFGEGWSFELLGSVPISTHADACFQIATNPTTGEQFFFVQEQSGQLSGRPYRKQGVIIPAISISCFKDKEEKCIEKFYAIAKRSRGNLESLR
jgi:hypothetical protein